MDHEAVTRWLKALEKEEILAVCVHTKEEIGLPPSAPADAEAPRRLVFPGAFNPLHAGHLAMADIASEETGLSAEFEISIQNVDKQLPDASNLMERLRQFSPHESVWLTNAMRFQDKAELFPSATFVVGADTLARIGDVAYYESEPHLADSLTAIKASGGGFLVFARRVQGKVCELDDLDLPPALSELCHSVPASRFCHDISSTEIRIAEDR